MNRNFFRKKVDEGLRLLLESPDEKADDKKLEEIVHRLKDKDYLKHRMDNQAGFDSGEAWRAFAAACKVGRKSKSFRGGAFLKAASVCLLLAAAGLYYAYDAGWMEGTVAGMPGTRGAVLLTQAGKKIELAQHEGVVKEAGVTFHYDATGLHYEGQSGKNIDHPSINTLIVPRGSEYALDLSDGTQVWLNADSRLRYAMQFVDTMREVRMSGEAYFKVRPQEVQPFVVRTRLGSIEVLGTEFNVQAYADQPQLTVTLIHGSIRYTGTDGKSYLLQPNQQLTVSDGQEPRIENVDVAYAIGWKEGKFLFQDRRLEEIFGQLERWYDCRVKYRNERVKDLHFSGDLNRYKDIDTFVKMFEESAGVKIEIEGKTLWVDL